MIPDFSLLDVDRLVRLHTSLLFTMLAITVITGLWALAGSLLDRPLAPRLLALAWIGTLLIVAECVIGGLIWASGARPARPEVHLIYALVALLSFPLTINYIRGMQAKSAYRTIALASLFLCSILLRALETARQ